MTLDINNDNDNDHPQWAHEEWMAEADRRFGEPLNWAFVCPMCKTVSSPAVFKELGVKPDRAGQECVGRVLNEQGAEPRHKTDNDTDHCDWAAFGLFRGPASILVEDDKVIPAFRFAPPPEEKA